MVIDPRVLFKTVKIVSPKKERITEAQVRGTIVYNSGEHYILLDGASSDSLTPIANIEEGSSDAGFVAGDRVLVLIKNHQAIVTKNLTTGLQAQAAKDASSFITTITDEGITAERIIANDTFTNTLRANNIRADDIIADHATITNLDVQSITVATGYIGDLISGNITAQSIIADHVKVDNLDTQAINAATGYIGSLTAGNVSASDIIADHVIVDSLDTQAINAATGYIGDLTTGNIRAQDIIADHTTIGSLDTTYATISALTADEARISAVEADTAKIHNLTANEISAATGYVGSLTAGNVSASDIISDHATVENLDSNYAHISNGVIDNAKIGHADVNGLNANYAHIANGVIDNATIDYADVDNLDAHYAEIDLANVNNAWLNNGVIKDAAISNEMVNSISANKLTAGTIDASNITVTNLNADNITTGTINGQRIGQGSLSLDKLSDAVYTESEVDSMLDTMQAEIDGAIETYTGSVVPTLNNTPASAWTTDDDKAKHVGDVYYVVNAGNDADGYCYRFAYDAAAHQYKWVLIKDSDVTAALQRLLEAEGDIDDLETFQSETSSWISNTDEELSSIKSNHTALSTVVDKTIKETVQLWYTKANTTAPNKPTAHVTVNDASKANQWNLAVPTYNASYPNYYYCYEWKYVDNTYGWSAVTRDIAMGETQSTARTANATANANIKSTVQLWFTKANTTAPNKPTSQVTTNDASTANQWNIAVPTYNATYPNYFYCYQYQKGDGTYSWSDVVYDRATTENQSNSRSALTQVSTKVETSTFNELSQTVDENSASITSLTTTVESKADSSTVTSLSNTVNSVSQTATSNSSKISSLTTTLGTNADGTTKTGDVMHQVSQLDQDLDGITTRVGKTEVQILGQYATCSTAKGTTAKVATITPAVTGWTLYTGATITVKFTNENTASTPTLNINSTGAKTIKTYSGGALSADEYKWKAGSTFTFTYNGTYWLMQDSTVATRMTSAESSISQNASNIALKVSKDGVISSINQSAETVKIQASKVEIDGTAIFNAISDDVDDAITDKGYATTTQAQGYATTAKNEAIAEIPTNISELNNDSGYQTASDVSGAIVSTTTLYYASNSTTAPNKPTAHVTTNSASTRGAWNIALPTYNSSYPYLYVCTETKTKGGAYAWTSVEQTTYASAISAIKTTADGAAPKSSAIAEEQRIYYRSNSSTKPNGNGLPTAWVTETGDKYNTNATTSTGWSRKVTPIANGTGSSVTKYLYLWTCIQKKTVDGTVTYGDILLDDSTTVIDGGKIVTGSVSANAVSATSGTFDTANIPNLNASKITAGDISADRMKVNSISAINGNTGTVKISASKVEIDGTATFNAIKSSADEAYDAKGSASVVQTNLDNLEVGGRNILLETATPKSWTVSLNSSNYQVTDCYKTYSPVPSIFSVDDLVTISFDWSTTGTSGNFHLECGKVTPYTWGTVVNAIGTRSATSNYIDITSSNTSGHAVITFKITSSQATAATTLEWFRIRIDGAEMASKTFTVSNAKAERGNKATDWTSAPEDVQAEVNAKIDGIEVGGRNYCAEIIKANNNTATTGISITYAGSGVWRVHGTSTGSGSLALYYIIDHFTSLGYGDTYTFSADTPIPSDCRLYVNFSTSSDTTSVKAVNGEYGESTLTFTCDSDKRIRYVGVNWKSGITIDFSSRYKLEKGNKATDWTPVPEDVDAQIDGIEIGGRNLLTDTDAPSLTKVHSPNNRYWSSSTTTGYTGTFEAMSGLPAYGAKYVARFAQTDNFSTVHYLAFYNAKDGCAELVRGNQYTASVWCKKVSGSDLKIYFQYGVTSYRVSNGIDLINDSEWHKYTWTFTADTGDAYYYADSSRTRLYFGGIKGSASLEVLLCGFKLEAGNKATDWTPAPEDVQAEIDSRKSIHNLKSSSAGATYSQILAWAADGTVNSSWGIDVAATPITNVRIGDTCRIAIKATDMGENGTIVYVIGTVTSISDSTHVRMTMRGLDTTVIDGGHILTGTIDANKVNIQNLTVGTAQSGWDSVMNSNIEVGGRNLLVDSESMASWRKAAGVSVENGVATLVGTSSNWSSELATHKYDLGIYDGTTTYVWSIEYKSSVACLVYPVIATTSHPIDDDTWTRTKYIGWQNGFTLPSTNGEWVKYVFDPRTIALSQLTSGSGDMVSGFLQLYARTDNANIQVRHCKLEKGNKATDWTPAPEDTLNSNLVSSSTVSGDVVHITDASEYPAIDITTQIEPIQSGSGTPSPDNVRPISGYDSVSVANMGDISKRQFFNGLMQGTHVFVDMGTLSWSRDTSKTNAVFRVNPPNNKTTGDLAILCAKYTNLGMMTFTSFGNTAEDKSISVQTSYGTVQARDDSYTTATAFKNSLSGVYLVYELATPTTPTITEAQFNMLLEQFDIDGELYIIDLPSTCYGGTLDVVSGVLTVTKAYVDLGTLTWAKGGSSFPSGTFYASTSGGATASNPPREAICNKYKPYSGGASGFTDKSFSYANSSLSSSTGRVFVCDSTYADATTAEFKTAMNGAQLVYELATPLEYNLTSTEVKLLAGTNNVWSNTGDTTLQYVTMGSDLLALAEQASKSNKFITQIGYDGIKVHAADNIDSNYVQIDSDGMEIFKDGMSVAQYSDTARIGQEDASHIEVYGDSIVGVSSTGNEFFSVTESGGSTTSDQWITIGNRTTGARTIDMSHVSAWSEIPSGGSFKIEVSYYYRKYTIDGYNTIRYDRKTVSFTRGTQKTSNAYVTYNGVNTITITASYPTTPDTHTDTYAGSDARFGYTVTTNGSLYRFGTDVAETGGANGFMMGTGTRATWDNQLAIGTYNAASSSDYLVVGNGTSDDARSNAFAVSKWGTVNVPAGGDYKIDGVGIAGDLFGTKQFSVSGVAFSTYYGTYTFNIAQDGYTPIAVSQVALSQALIHTYNVSLSSTSCSIGVSKGTASGTISSLYIQITVVYVKNEFITALT